MLVNYQKNWEGSSLTTPANGVIVFYPLKDGVVKQVWLRVQEPVTHDLRWAVYYSDGGYVTDFLITTGQVLGGSTLPDGFSVSMLSHLRVDLIETNGATAHIPIVFEVAIEETIELSYSELQDIPTTFPPAAHDHDSRYYTKTEIEAQAGNYELSANKNISDGYAGLDADARVLPENLPPYVFDLTTYGAVADGITDCTDALSDALDAVIAKGGGVIIFPEGTTLISAGGVSKNFTGSEGLIVFRGTGNSKIQIANDATDKVLLSNAKLVVYENLTIIGHPTAGTACFNNYVFGFNFVDRVLVRNCVLGGVRCVADVSASGLFYADSCNIRVENCVFGGCGTANTANISAMNWKSVEIHNTQFVDYVDIDSIYYEGGSTANSWIATDTPAANETQSVIIRNSFFDEGVGASAISIANGGRLDIDHAFINKGGSFGIHVFSAVGTDYGTISIKNTFIGKTGGSTADGCGIRIQRYATETVILEDVKFGNDINYVQLDTNISRLIARRCDFHVGVTYPTGVNNNAGALLDMDSLMPTTPSATALVPLALTTHVTGTTSITSIVATNFKAGDVLRLIFDGILTLTAGNNIKIETNFITKAGSQIVLTFDGTNFYESTVGTRVLAALLTGYSVGSNAILAATDTILGAFQKIQGQLNAVLSRLLTGISFADSTDVTATDSILVAIGKLQAQATSYDEVPWIVVHRSNSVALNLTSYRVINDNATAISAITLTIPDGASVALTPGVFEFAIAHSGIGSDLSFELPDHTKVFFGDGFTSPNAIPRFSVVTFNDQTVGQYVHFKYLGQYSGDYIWILETVIGKLNY
jgi:hypothetical protein